MPIDASIPLGAKTDYGSPLDTAAKALTLKHLMTLGANAPMRQQADQLKLEGAQLDIEAKQREAEQQKGITAAFQESFDQATGKLDKAKALSNLYKVSPEYASKWATDTAKSDQEFSKSLQESHKNFVALAGPLSKSIADDYDKQIASGVPPEAAEASIRPRIESAMGMLTQAGFGGEFHGGDPSKITVDTLRGIAGQWGDGMKIDEQRASGARADRRNDIMERRVAAQEKAASGDFTNFSDEEVNALAESAAKDRSVLIGLGRTKEGAALLMRVNKAIAGGMVESGDDVADTRAQFAADKKSLATMTSQYDAITSFEKTAIRNGQSLVKLAEKVDSTGLPAVERWFRAGKKATGDADVAAFNAQMQVYRTEAARILTNPNLTGVLSDSARQEVAEFVNNASSAEQVRRVVELLKRDFENRKQTLEDQMAAAKGRMKSGNVAGQDDKNESPQEAAKPVHDMSVEEMQAELARLKVGK